MVSHGANSPRTDRSRFRLEFDWTGTGDPTAYLAVPAALDYMGSLLPGGWPALMDRNREPVLAARAVVASALEVAPPCPATMLGSMAALPLRGRRRGGRRGAGVPARRRGRHPGPDRWLARAGCPR